jgi:DNA-binding NarL/FixJ family response regulator
MTTIRVLLIADNRLFGDGVTVILNAENDIKADAIFGLDADELARGRALRPTVILFDAELAITNCLKSVRHICSEFPASEVLVMNLRASRTQVLDIMRAGASGVILKNDPYADMLASIRSVANGKLVLPASLAEPLPGPGVKPTSKRILSDSLSRRELEVVEYIAQGLSNRQIASKLELSIHTIKSHIHHILTKLSLNSRLQIARHVLSDRRDRS